MKKFFEEAEATLLAFETEDVICTSGIGPGTGVGGSEEEDTLAVGGRAF